MCVWGYWGGGGGASCRPFCGPFADSLVSTLIFYYSFYLCIYLCALFSYLFCLGGRKRECVLGGEGGGGGVSNATPQSYRPIRVIKQGKLNYAI